MARIKIRNLPKGMKVSAEELKGISGGLDIAFSRSYSLPTAIVRTKPIRYKGEITTQVDWGGPAYESGCSDSVKAAWPKNVPDCPKLPIVEG